MSGDKYEAIEVKTHIEEGQKMIRIQDVVSVLDHYTSESAGSQKRMLEEINKGFKKLLSS